jgi:serine O-acetyltransferase
LSFFSSVFLRDLPRYSSKASLRGVLGALVRSPGYGACVLLRLQQLAFSRGHSVFACLLRNLGISLFGLDAVPGNRVGAGLLLPHPNGVVIGKDAVVGTNATILQGVTLGERYVDGTGPHLYPVLGTNVSVGAGAKILGGVQVGDGAVIGANSVVLSDCPPNSVFVGAPAKRIAVSASVDLTSDPTPFAV